MSNRYPIERRKRPHRTLFRYFVLLKSHHQGSSPTTFHTVSLGTWGNPLITSHLMKVVVKVTKALVVATATIESVVRFGRQEQHVHTEEQLVCGFGSVSFENLGVIALALQELTQDVFDQSVGAKDGYGLW